MKKIITILSLVFITSIAFSQDSIIDNIKNYGNTIDSTITAVDQNSAANKLVDKVSDALENIAVGLKTTSENVFRIYSIYFRAKGIMYTVFSFLGLMFFFNMYKKAKPMEEYNTDVTPIFVKYILPFIGSLFILINYLVSSAFIMMIVPEYFVIDALLENIKLLTQ